MNIAIIGSGRLGENLACLFAKAGYRVGLANSRGPASLHGFAAELAGKVLPMTLPEAVAYGDVIFVVPLWHHLDELPVFPVPHKVIVDTTNPYRADGAFYDLRGVLSSRKVMEHFPGGRLVKAFNTIRTENLAYNGTTLLPVEERIVLPLAGDDEAAKRLVSRLITDIGFGPLDTGTLETGSWWQGVDGILYGKAVPLKEARALMRQN